MAEKKRKSTLVRGVCNRSLSITNCNFACSFLSTYIPQDVAGQGLQVRKIPKLCGVGVFCLRSFSAGDVVVRYVGETITTAEANKRDKLRTQVRTGVLVVCRVHISVVSYWMFDAASCCSIPRHTHAV
ncbi:MAG: hypothetical protein ACKVQA_26265 [Burkholderiales bacterium]